MQFENCYTSSNCNQVPTVAHWGKNNLICYGSCNSVMIYDPNYGSGGKVIKTLTDHLKRVNSVKWLSGKNVQHESEIISGSSDCTVIIWSLQGSHVVHKTLEVHNSNVNIVEGLYKGDNKKHAIVASASMDCTIQIWSRINLEDEFVNTQKIDLGYNLVVGLCLSFLPSSGDLILAYGLNNSKILVCMENGIEPGKFDETVQLLGHEDWERGLDFTVDGDDLLLASCSQDACIRLWRMSENNEAQTIESFAKQKVEARLRSYNVYLESVLTGHEGWIYSVNWSDKTLNLLSASIDKSMIIWQFDANSGLWLDKIRVGEVGGNTLGFYGGRFSPSGDEILAYSYHGAFHIWKKSEELGSWVPRVTVGGHFSEVVDCAWEPKGEFLYTCGYDQTTRIHAPWPTKRKKTTWHEIARPQVHGYDMSALAVMSRYRYVSAAEEKVIRVFEAPANFVENFRRICHVEKDVEGNLILKNVQAGPRGASVPSLGLSNKAVYTDNNIDRATPIDKRNNFPEESHFTAVDMTEPPTEETLLQNTLWPETQKLYGHGYEVYSLAASPDGKFIASACKSSKPEHSAVLIWDTSCWKQVQKLMSHTLTVVQLQFSPNSKHLLTVSRDRRWSLFSRNQEGVFELAAMSDKKTGVHSRIIWTCAWSHDSKFFATGSRDGKLAFWTINQGKEKALVLGECELASEPLEFKNQSVTAVAFAPCLVEDKYFVAVGLESGLIDLYLWCLQERRKVFEFTKCDAHHLTVRRLAFRPVLGRAGDEECDENILQLASCGSDCAVKIYDLHLQGVCR